jgi:uncharacterized protein YjbI with pentapeptide repeats
MKKPDINTLKARLQVQQDRVAAGFTTPNMTQFINWDLSNNILWNTWVELTLPVPMDLRLCYFEDCCLSTSTFKDAKFEGSQLVRVHFIDCNLNGASFEAATLEDVRFDGSQMEGVSFKEAKLSEVSFRNARLQDADLTDCRSLHSEQLGGADLTAAKLPPEILKFAGLDAVTQSSKHAQKLFTVILLGCLYCWLTIGATTDVQLFTGGASWTLPVLGSAIKIAGFYILAPIILLCLYFYLHLYLQRMWRNLGALPAKFPDGRSLDERADSWLAVGVVRSHMKLLKYDKPAFSRLQSIVVAFLLWWLVPLTIAWFWVRFLTVHDWLWSIVHVLTLTACAGFGVLDYGLTKSTLSGTARAGRWLRHIIRTRWLSLAAKAIVFLPLVGFITLGTIEGVPVGKGTTATSAVQGIYSLLGYEPFADFQEEDVSTRPEDWPQRQHASEVPSMTTYIGGNYEVVRGAKLRERNLNYARAVGAFLVNADLRGANLRGADLARADLRGADCTDADFSSAELRRTDLVGTILVRANMTGVMLQGTDLSRATIGHANFTGATFDAVYLPSSLDSCDLRSADLSEIGMLARSQLRTAIYDSTTKLPKDIIPD